MEAFAADERCNGDMAVGITVVVEVVPNAVGREARCKLAWELGNEATDQLDLRICLLDCIAVDAVFEVSGLCIRAAVWGARLSVLMPE